MFTNPETTDISAMQFNIGASTNGEATPTPLVETKVLPDEKPEAVPPTDKVVPPVDPVTPAADVIQATDPVESKPIDPQDPIELSYEDVDDILRDSTGGKVDSFSDLQAKLQRLEELEANPSLGFNDPTKKQIFEFLNKYQGSDYTHGIENFVRLQQLDIQSMDAESALKELHIIENVKLGLSKQDAEILWETEKADKYDSRGDTGEILKKRDAIVAKEKLTAMKADTITPKVDSQQETIQAQQIQERQNYLDQVDQAIKNEQGQFTHLSVSFSDNPDDDFNFQMEDREAVNASIRDYGGFVAETYKNKDNSWNMEAMKQDVALLKNKEKYSQAVFEHGKTRGREEAMRERTNTPARNTPASNAPAGGSPKTMTQAILEGMGKK